MGPIQQFLEADHRRLESILDRATADPGHVDMALYAQFREGLLRHIAMEEKVLLTSARDHRGGQAMPVAKALRKDHGMITSLMVPSPDERIIRLLRKILQAHNPLEEGPAGLYAECDGLMKNNTGALVDRLKNMPPVKMMPHNDSARAHAIVDEIEREVLAR